MIKQSIMFFLLILPQFVFGESLDQFIASCPLFSEEKDISENIENLTTLNGLRDLDRAMPRLTYSRSQNNNRFGGRDEDRFSIRTNASTLGEGLARKNAFETQGDARQMFLHNQFERTRIDFYEIFIQWEFQKLWQSELKKAENVIKKKTSDVNLAGMDQNALKNFSSKDISIFIDAAFLKIELEESKLKINEAERNFTSCRIPAKNVVLKKKDFESLGHQIEEQKIRLESNEKRWCETELKASQQLAKSKRWTWAPGPYFEYAWSYINIGKQSEWLAGVEWNIPLSGFYLRNPRAHECVVVQFRNINQIESNYIEAKASIQELASIKALIDVVQSKLQFMHQEASAGNLDLRDYFSLLRQYKLLSSRYYDRLNSLYRFTAEDKNN